MLPFSMALMSGLKRQSVGAKMASMPGSSSLRDIAKFVKWYICGRKRRNWGYYMCVFVKCRLETHTHFYILFHGTECLVWGLWFSCVCVFLYHSRVWWSGVYPPQQSASWYNRNRLLDFRHVICIIVLRSIQLLLETELLIVTAVTL